MPRGFSWFLLVVLLLPATLRAQDILVLPVRGTVLEYPTLHESAGAALIDDLLSLSEGELTFVDLSDGTPIADVTAPLYFDTCPHDPVAELGCAQILGETSKMNYVLLPRIVSLAGEEVIDPENEGPAEMRTSDMPTEGTELAVMEFRLVDIKKSLTVAAWSVPVRGVEDPWIARSVLLSLEHLRNPPADPEQDARILSELQEQERERFLRAERDAARRDLDARVENDGFRADENARRAGSSKLTDEDLDRMARSASPPWESYGLSPKQYKSWRNSRLALEEWQKRDAGHFMQLLVGAGLGVGGGPSVLSYYGAFLRNNDLSGRVEDYAWQAVGFGPTFNIEGFVGFGITTFLEVEFAFGVMPTRLLVKEVSAKLNDDNTAVDQADIYRRLSEPFLPVPYWLPYIEPRVRYMFFNVPRIKPTLGAGVHVRFFPLPQERVDFLCRSEGVSSWDECVDPEYPVLVKPWQAVSLYLEPGGIFEVNRNLGIFVRLPIMVALKPLLWEYGTTGGVPVESRDDLRFLVGDAAPDALPNRSPASIRFVVGVQGRLFGKIPKNQNNESDFEVD